MKQPISHITLITTNAIGFPPIILHRAISFRTADGKKYVIHRTTSGIEIVSYETFMNGRFILAEKKYPIRYPFNPQQIKNEDRTKFDWVNNNCEDFTSDVLQSACGIHLYPKSPQRTFWIFIVAITLVILIYARSKK